MWREGKRLGSEGMPKESLRRTKKQNLSSCLCWSGSEKKCFWTHELGGQASKRRAHGQWRSQSWKFCFLHPGAGARLAGEPWAGKNIPERQSNKFQGDVRLEPGELMISSSFCKWGEPLTWTGVGSGGLHDINLASEFLFTKHGHNNQQAKHRATVLGSHAITLHLFYR